LSEFTKQCKGEDADKLKILDSELFYTSIKYDGVYIQMHKTGDLVQFFTSSGKEFSCVYAAEFAKLDFDFKIETEYICDGGKLGTRAKADNEIKKAVKDSSFQLTGEFMIFDALSGEYYEDRLGLFLKFLQNNFKVALGEEISFREAKEKLEEVAADGWEGLFLKKATHVQVAGKKSKDAVKLKKKYTADLVCVGWDGYYLLLQDDNGLTAKVAASGMQDYIKEGDIVEIEYEQIIKTYNQAVFKAIRHDKMCS